MRQDDQSANGGPAGKKALPRPCPICGKPPTEAMKPFCSKRCADVDLHRWLGGTYALPASESDEDDDPPDEDPSLQ
jgi:hypothetical protein